MVDGYFFWSGVIVNAVGAFAICGLLARLGIDWWVRFSGVQKPLMEWYWEKLKKEKPRYPA